MEELHHRELARNSRGDRGIAGCGGIPKLNVGMELGNSSAIKTAVAAGQGVSMFSRRAFMPSGGRMRKHVLSGCGLVRDFYLITVAERYNSPASVNSRTAGTGGGSRGLCPNLPEPFLGLTRRFPVFSRYRLL
jgi:DNA-binding transcriptional LysR family regulator